MKYKIEGDGVGKSKTRGYHEKSGWADPTALEMHPGSCVGHILRKKELAGAKKCCGLWGGGQQPHLILHPQASLADWGIPCLVAQQFYSKLISCSTRGFLTRVMFQLLGPAQPLSSPTHPQKVCRPISTWAVSTSPGRGPVILLLQHLSVEWWGPLFSRARCQGGWEGCGWVTTHPMLTTSSRTLSAGAEQSAWALKRRES